MFDEKTQETLRRLLDLAEHPNTSQPERAMAITRIRSLVGSPDSTRRVAASTARDADMLRRVKPLTGRVEEGLVEEVHADLYAFGTRYRVIGEVAEELAQVLERWSTMPGGKRHRYDDTVKAAAWRLTYLLERGDLLRKPAWNRSGR